MTHFSKELGSLIIMPEKPDKCEICGKVAETRPYGKNGARICFQCAMKDRKTTEEQMNKMMRGEMDSSRIVCVLDD